MMVMGYYEENCAENPSPNCGARQSKHLLREAANRRSGIPEKNHAFCAYGNEAEAAGGEIVLSSTEEPNSSVDSFSSLSSWRIPGQKVMGCASLSVPVI